MTEFRLPAAPPPKAVARASRTLGLLAALSFLPAAAVLAQDQCPSLSGKTVQLIVPFSPGGGFDTYARMVAKYFGQELGAANMIVLNQPGAGGLLAANQMFRAAPDGLTIQIMNASGMLTAELGGAEGVNFKTGEFSWIGRISGEPDVIAVGVDSTIDTIDDIRALSGQRQVLIGSTGVGDVDYIEGQILTRALDLDSRIIVGFSGAPEVYTSLARGELDLFSSSLSAAQQAEIGGLAKIKWLVASEPDPDAPDIPPIAASLDAEDAALVDAQADVTASGRSLAAPPAMDAALLQCMRDAFDRTMQLAELQADSEQLGRPLAPIGGMELQQIIEGLTSNPPESYVELLKTVFSGN